MINMLIINISRSGRKELRGRPLLHDRRLSVFLQLVQLRLVIGNSVLNLQ